MDNAYHEALYDQMGKLMKEVMSDASVSKRKAEDQGTREEAMRLKPGKEHQI